MHRILTSKARGVLLAGGLILSLVAGLAIVEHRGSEVSLRSASNEASAQGSQEMGDPGGAFVAQDAPGLGAQDAPGQRGRRGLARLCRAARAGGRMVHGDLIVRADQDGTDTPQFRNVTVDAGEVTAVDGDSLTLKRLDGHEVTVKLTDQTRSRRTPSVGDQVRVVADTDGAAIAVMSRPASGDQSGARQGVRDRIAARCRALRDQAGQAGQAASTTF